MTPERTVEQRREALRMANEVRVYRRDLKERIERGAVSVTDVLLDPPMMAEGMKVVDLLLAQYGFGDTKLNAVMRRVGMAYTKTVGGLSDRQRRELVACLAERSGRRVAA